MKRRSITSYNRGMRAVAFSVSIIFLVSAFLSKPVSGQQSSRPVSDFVKVNGVTLQFRDWGGKGDALLFLSGLGGTAYDFDRMAPKFTDSLHVLGLTRRGQGESDKPPAGYDVDTLALDIKAFLDAKTISRASIVGYSIAGNEMTRLASLHPERVAKLVYLDAAYDAAATQAFLEKVNAQFQFKLIPTDFDKKSLAAILLSR